MEATLNPVFCVAGRVARTTCPRSRPVPPPGTAMWGQDRCALGRAQMLTPGDAVTTGQSLEAASTEPLQPPPQRAAFVILPDVLVNSPITLPTSTLGPRLTLPSGDSQHPNLSGVLRVAVLHSSPDFGFPSSRRFREVARGVCVQ